MPELVKMGAVGPDTARFQIADLASPCEQRCQFCPRSLDVRRPEPGAGDLVPRVRRHFEHFLAHHPQHDIVLLSADILRWPDLHGLLDLAAGRRVTLLTPGLRLADAAFADTFAGRNVRFDLTWLADDPATWERMTGRADAWEKMHAAVAQLRRLGLPFRLSTVLNTTNVASLPAIVHRCVALGARHVTVRFFWPDQVTQRRSFYDQFPSFSALQAALDALAADPPDPAPTLDLTNVPWCQIRLPTSLPVFMRPGKAAHNTHAAAGLPECATCSEAQGCVRVHPEQRSPPAPVDPEQIRANLDHSAAVLDAARQAGGGAQTSGWVG